MKTAHFNNNYEVTLISELFCTLKMLCNPYQNKITYKICINGQYTIKNDFSEAINAYKINKLKKNKQVLSEDNIKLHIKKRLKQLN